MNNTENTGEKWVFEKSKVLENHIFAKSDL